MSVKLSNLEAAQLNKHDSEEEIYPPEKKEEVEMRIKKTEDKNVRDSVISLKHYDNLLCDLRCPGCTTPLYVPIVICCAGHSICQKCRYELTCCPVCDNQWTDIRSYTLERLVGKFQFPCTNIKNGCTVRLPFELMQRHEKKCIYKLTTCFMGKIWRDCEWKGRENDWLEHTKNKHSNKILTNSTNKIRWCYESLKNHPGPILTYHLIQIYDETFNLYQVHEKANATLTWTIIQALNKKNPQKKGYNRFSYEVELFRENDPSHLIIQRFPVHFESSDKILNDGNCVKLKIKDVERFLDAEKTLSYNVKIIDLEQKTQDRWDTLLNSMAIKDNALDDFEDFEDEVYMEGDKLAVVLSDSKVKTNEEDDLLKQIFQKEFSQTANKGPIKKPPRKSLENLNARSISSDPHSSLKSLPVNFD